MEDDAIHMLHRTPTHEEIAVAAYFIWLQQTALPDYDVTMGEDMAVTNWLIAEEALQKECDDAAAAEVQP